MDSKYLEIEAKFLLGDPIKFERNLIQSGAQLVQPRCLEVNYRFDNKEGTLTTSSKVLRLRQDHKQWITFKSAHDINDDVLIRKEIEFEIGDIQAAQALLVELGFTLIHTYEKYRQEYSLAENRIMLDELPYGTFIEIESSDLSSLESCARTLRLNWDRRIDLSYMQLYQKLCEFTGLKFGDLTFNQSSFSDLSLEKIHIHPADL